LYYCLVTLLFFFCFFFSSRRRHTRFKCDWSSDVCSSDLQKRPLAGLEAANVFAGFDNLSRNIAAQSVRQADPGETLADPNIKMVQRASSDANQHLIVARFRIRNIFVAQNFRTAEFVNADGFHVSSDTKSNYHIRPAKIA